MKKFILAALLSLPTAAMATPEYAERIVTFNPYPVCADLVGIPRNSDAFGYDDWRKFQHCVKYFESVDGTLY